MSPEKITIDLTDKSILDNGVIEYLILSGRIPRIRESTAPSPDGYHSQALCIVPPPGSMPDDTMFEPSVGACEFISRRDGVSHTTFPQKKYSNSNKELRKQQS